MLKWTLNLFWCSCMNLVNEQPPRRRDAEQSISDASMNASFLGLKAELERSKASSSSSSKRKTSSTNLDKPSKKLSSTFLSDPSRPKKKKAATGVRYFHPDPKSKGKSRERDQESTPAQLEAIKKNLERKARIYDQLSAGKYAGLSSEALREGSIDWSRKLAEPRPRSRSRSASPQPSLGGNEEIVEYVDEFGRTRSAPLSEVPRELLPSKYGGDREDEDEGEDNAIYGPATSFPIYDPALHPRERRKEGEGRERYNAELESRHRGAAYYKFSKDERERERQMRELKGLREETKVEREKVVSKEWERFMSAQSREQDEGDG